MMQIEYGDIVRLTETALATFKIGAHDLYQQVQPVNQYGGTVLEISDSRIVIDFRPYLENPLGIELPNGPLSALIELVKKNPIIPDASPGQSPALVEAAVAVEESDESAAQPVQHGACCPGMPLSLSPMQSGQLPPGPMMQPQTGEAVLPPKVRMSQWVMTQFIGLKQYGIVQDLHRNDDAAAPKPDPRGELYDKPALRAVTVELSEAEDGLYNAALMHLKQYIST